MVRIENGESLRCESVLVEVLSGDSFTGERMHSCGIDLVELWTGKNQKW